MFLFSLIKMTKYNLFFTHEQLSGFIGSMHFLNTLSKFIKVNYMNAYLL